MASEAASRPKAGKIVALRREWRGLGGGGRVPMPAEHVAFSTISGALRRKKTPKSLVSLTCPPGLSSDSIVWAFFSYGFGTLEKME